MKSDTIKVILISLGCDLQKEIIHLQIRLNFGPKNGLTTELMLRNQIILNIHQTQKIA